MLPAGAVMDEISAEIAQISFYLGKEKQTFETIIDPEVAVSAKKAFRSHDFDAGEAKCRFLYFETVSEKKNPPWLDFANEMLPDEKKVNFKSKSDSANGILLISLHTRLFVATFGRSAGSCLHQRALEPDFGIKTAMNMCGNEEIRQTKSQSNTITPTQIDRQVAKPADSFTFGLSEAEDLRYISAHMKGDKNVTLQGRDSLTLKVIGKSKLTWVKLIAQCEKFHAEYDSKDYVKLFPNYRNFRVATDKEAETLDAEIIKTLRAGDLSKISLGIPEFVSEEDYSYAYTNHPARENIIYGFLEPRQLKECFDLPNITISQLQNKKIFAYSPVEDRILSYKKWYVYDCISFEHKLGEAYFVLSDGRWLEVDPEFYATIMHFIGKTLREEPCEDLYKGIDISDDTAKKNQEKIFNDTVCDRRRTAVKFDRAKLRIGNGRRDKEFCDVLDMEDDGVVRIINCKPYKDAASINYLFSQAKFYGDAFLHDEIFLSEIRDHIEKSTCPIKNKYIAYISETIEELSGRNYRLCLWLLYDQSDKTPTKADIPLIAQYELKLMHDHLRKACKFSDIILRFVPVKVTNYKTSKTPAKAA
jgi:uncharacterized protein (TIGR04141 family)